MLLAPLYGWLAAELTPLIVFSLIAARPFVLHVVPEVAATSFVAEQLSYSLSLGIAVDRPAVLA